MSVESTLRDRGKTYGDFQANAGTSQGMQDILRASPGWARLTAPQKEALTAIVGKIARIVNGDPKHIDNWHDIQGYARLVEVQLIHAGVVSVEDSYADTVETLRTLGITS